MKIYLTYYNKTSGGAGRFINLIKDYLEKNNYKITHNLKEKDIDAALINANSDSFSNIVDFKFRNPKSFITHRLDGLVSREKRLQSDLIISDINKLTDYSIFQSQHCAKVFSPYIKHNNYSVIINGSEFKKTLSDIEFEGKLKIYNVSWAGGEWKQLDKVFDFIKSNQYNPKIHFYLAGNYQPSSVLIENKIDCTKNLKNKDFFNINNNLFKDFKNVTYLGYLNPEELMPLISSMDYLFFLSKIDSCPNTVIEAIKCGVPVIYHNSGGTPEIVGDAGVDIENFNYNYLNLVDHLEEKKEYYKKLAVKRGPLLDISLAASKYEGIIKKGVESKSKIFVPNLKVGWIMCYNSCSGSSRIGGFNIHTEMNKLGIYSKIVHINHNFSVTTDVPAKNIIEKIKILGINTVIFQKVCQGEALKVATWCKNNGIKVIFAIGDFVDSQIYNTADMTITTSPYFVEYLKTKYPGIKNVYYIEDAIETDKNIYKVHRNVSNLTVGWFGNKDRFSYDTSIIKSFMQEKDKLITISNTPEATYMMGYGCKDTWDIKKLTEILIKSVDVIALPINTSEEKNLFKSANRLTLAYSLGIPVISTPIPSYEYVTLGFGSLNLFSDFKDVKKWKEHLNYLRDITVRKKLSSLGRNYIINRYCKETVAKEWVIALRSLF